jgi:hypothetical protein
MIALAALLFRRSLKPSMVEEARRQADRGVLGRMEGHAEMDMSVTDDESLWRRLAFAAVLVRYFRNGGGLAMLRIMNTPMEQGHGHAHHHDHEIEVPHAH